MTFVPQFVMALDIIEDFIRGEGYKYLRLVIIYDCVERKWRF
jgi:hypothetical protein